MSNAAAKRQARLQSSEEVMTSLHHISPLLTAGGSFQEPAQALAKFASHSGTMSKQSKKWSMIWRKRFFLILPDGFLYYFSSPTDMKPLKSIDVREITMVMGSQKYKKHGITIEISSGRAYFFACESDEEAQEWVNAIMVARKEAHEIHKLHAKQDSFTTSLKPTTVTRKRSHLRNVSLTQQRLSTVFSKQSASELQPWFDWAVETMICGAVVTKFPYLGACSGKPKKRFLALKKDQTALVWGTSKQADNLNRELPITCITNVLYGPYSLTFSYFLDNLKGKWKTLSIVCSTPDLAKMRTIDLQFKTENDALGFLIGVLYLANKNNPILDDIVQNALSSYKWEKFKLQVIEKAETLKKPPSETMAAIVANYFVSSPVADD